jgi:hypothetical protein
MKVDIASKGDVRIKFRKQGYFDVERSVLINGDNMIIKENLQEEQYARLIINSFNAGADYKIVINNENKSTYELRREIKVPANQNLVVEVTNSLGFRAREVVNVQENTRRTLDMVLKKVE